MQTQGKRTLSALCSKDFEQIVVLPSGVESFSWDASFARAFLLEQVEGAELQDREVFWRVAGADPWLNPPGTLSIRFLAPGRPITGVTSTRPGSPG